MCRFSQIAKRLQPWTAVLRLGAVAGALAVASAAAQAPLDIRVALIMGNSAYVGAPELGNPANDARAMSALLRSLGFTVLELRDGSKAQMAAAISQVSDSLKGKQGVGMLYYAGHGLQLDWHNYMVPVDARLKSAADVPLQTIDLNSVIDAFKMAGNRMNIVVLDACRNNPFASHTSSAKGLAQLDAPPGTFLAYATAPGNVAEDGSEESGNGLYTQFLLQELKKPTAKIEDVFKRVRLNVRKQSEGRQIPWESTSLEDDFFFNDGVKFTLKLEGAERLAAQVTTPVPDKTLSKEQLREIAFKEEKAAWDGIKNSNKADDFYAFLQRYPSAGELAEMAQYRLDQLAKPKIQAALGKGQDASLGYTGARYIVGDQFEIQPSDMLTNVPGPKRTVRVTSITDDLVEFNHGASVVTALGAVVKNKQGTFDPPYGGFPVEFQVGKTWSGRSSLQTQGGEVMEMHRSSKIIGRETITVPAGVFQTYVVEVSAFFNQRSQNLKLWIDPRYGYPVKSEELVRKGGRIIRSDRIELAAIKAPRS